MEKTAFYVPFPDPAAEYARAVLQQAGCRFVSAPSPQVQCLLLPVPTPAEAASTLPSLLEELPGDVRIFGGKLPPLPGCRVFDLLTEPAYTAQNAYITACCALRLILTHQPVLRDCPILIIGWGQIGKCLSRLLQALEGKVTVAARRETDRATAAALGYGFCSTEALSGQGYRVIVNTVPAMLLPHPPEDCLKLELASQPGLGGEDVLVGHRLPGRLAPRQSGELIGRSVLSLCRKEGLL